MPSHCGAVLQNVPLYESVHKQRGAAAPATSTDLHTAKRAQARVPSTAASARHGPLRRGGNALAHPPGPTRRPHARVALHAAASARTRLHLGTRRLRAPHAALLRPCSSWSAGADRAALRAALPPRSNDPPAILAQLPVARLRCRGAALKRVPTLRLKRGRRHAPVCLARGVVHKDRTLCELTRQRPAAVRPPSHRGHMHARHACNYRAALPHRVCWGGLESAARVHGALHADHAPAVMRSTPALIGQSGSVQLSNCMAWRTPHSPASTKRPVPRFLQRTVW